MSFDKNMVITAIAFAGFSLLGMWVFRKQQLSS